MQALLETPLGIGNADEIAALDGLDMLGIGANDLTTELGVPGQYELVRDAVAVWERHVNGTGSCSSWAGPATWSC